MQSGSSLPADVIAAGQSPVFDESSLPPALRSEHRTAKGVYGLLRVLSGSLEFVWMAADGEQSAQLEEGSEWVIEPELPHRVVPGGQVRCQIEFYRLPETDGE